jgi:hypothetical protein
MDYDKAKVEDAVLALLALFAFNHGRSWKGYDWEVMGALHEKGLISDPVNRNKSVYLTEEGLAAGRAAAARLFGTPSKPSAAG